MSEFFEKTLKALNYKKLLPYAVLVILLAVSVLTWQFYENTSLEKEELRYNEYVDRVIDNTTERLHQYEMILLGGAGIFFASDEVTREVWQTYYQSRQGSTSYPGIHRITICQVIQPSELAQHIEEIRASGFPDYKVWPDGEREVYTPIVYLEPFDELSRRGFGYDPFSEPMRRAAMERARDTGAAVITGTTTLVTENDQDNQPSFIMFVPIYTQGIPLNTPEERRAAIEGYVAGAFRTHDMMQSIFPGDTIYEINFQLYDGTEISPAALIYYRHVSPDAKDEEYQPLFTSRKTLDLYGHQWTMAFETTPAFEAAIDRYTRKYIFAAGLLISFLVFFYLKTLVSTGDRAHALAQKMTSALRESEQKYRYMTENISDVIWSVDLEGNITYASPAIEELIGFTPEEIMGMPMDEYIVKEDFAALVARLAEELVKPPAELARSTIVEARYITKDNRHVYAESNISWIIDEQGNLIGVQGTTRDITERKKLEEQIIESKKMYQSVVDTQQEMISRYLPDATLTFVNDAYCRAFGMTRRELLGQKYLMFISSEAHEEEIKKISHFTPDKSRSTQEYRILLPDGNTVWQEWTDYALFNASGELREVQGVGRDITERVQAEGDLLQAYDATIEGWAYALDLRDEETEGHSVRVTDLTTLIARQMGFKENELVHVKRGALLHDIGKMGIPDNILLKPGPLTEDERMIMRRHPRLAYKMLLPIDYLRLALDIPFCHHEKWDGTGYPRRLKGEQIPLAARIFAVVDVYDALTSDRPYRKAWSKEEALEYIKKESGKHFDPEVVEVFLQEII